MVSTKDRKLWFLVVFLVAISGCIIIVALATRSSTRSSTPPENATLIPDLGQISFNLSLTPSEIMVFKGESINITIILYSHEKVDLLLAIGKEGSDVDASARTRLGLPPELPQGITANFDQTEIVVEASSTVNVNLTLSIGNEAVSGTYKLSIFADQRTSYGGRGISVPLQLTVKG